jgi:hypothetical protein
VILRSFHTRQAGLIAPLLVEKCLGGREKTKQKAVEAFLLLIEIEAHEAAIVSLACMARYVLQVTTYSTLHAHTRSRSGFGCDTLFRSVS